MSNTVSVTETPNSVVVVEADNTVTVTQADNAVTVASPGPVGPAPAMETYAPQGGTAGEQPTFSGDPLITGRYVRAGDLTFFDVQVDMDNITGFGTGQYFVTVPFPALRPTMVRDGCLHDANTGDQYHISGHLDAGSTTLQLFTTDVSGQRLTDFEFEQGEPITLTTSDNFHINGSYLAVAINTPPGKVGTVSPTAGNAQVELSWTAPSPGGSPIVDYVVQYSTDGSNWTTFPDGTSAATTATVTGLSNGTLYYFRVAAVNDAATGEFSDAVTATPTAAFSPLDLSPVLWLDASDTSTITEVGGAVSQWDDKSGNGNDVAQGTAAAQPTSGTRTLNGLNVIDFDGSDYFKTAASVNIAQPSTIFLVLDVDSTASPFFFDSHSATPRFIAGISTDFFFNAGTSIFGSAGSTGSKLFRYTFDGASSSMFIDGVSDATGDAGSNSLGLITVGARYTEAANFTNGAFAEVIIVDGTLTADEIADTEQYLADKWGITLP